MRQRTPRRDLSDLAHFGPDGEPARTAPYLRVSLADREDKRKPTFEEERSTGTQRRVYQEWASRAGVQTADEYTDPDMSASRFAARKNRPDFERMVGDIRAGKLDVIWFWEISRQQRRLEVFAELRNLCRDKGVLWVVRDRVLDPANSQDMLLAGIQSMIAEDESEKLSGRVYDGKESSAVKGKRAGRIPYGYKRGKWDERTETFGPDEPDVSDGHDLAQDSPAYIVREISSRLYMGESITRIRRDLNDRGIRTKPDKNHPEGSTWSNSQVRYIAMNPAYAGLRVRHVEKGGGLSRRASKILEGVEVAWPPLVDADTFWAVYRKLADPQRIVTRTDRPGGRLLSAVGSCGVCGGKLTVHKANSRQRQRDDIYTCKEKSCASVYVSDLEEYVTEVMIRWLSHPETAAQLAGDGDPETAAATALAHADLDRANAEHGELLRSAKRGALTLVMAETMEHPILERIADAKRRIEDAATPPVLRGLIGEQAADGWAALTVPQRRQVIAAVASIRVHRVGRHGCQQVPVRDRVGWRWLLGPGAGQDDGDVEEKIRVHYATRQAQLAQRQAKAAHMREEGWTVQEIAAELGIGVSTARKDITAARNRHRVVT